MGDTRGATVHHWEMGNEPSVPCGSVMTNGDSGLAEKAEGQESAIVIDEIGGPLSDVASERKSGSRRGKDFEEEETRAPETPERSMRPRLNPLAHSSNADLPWHWEQKEAEASDDGLALHRIREDDARWLCLSDCLQTRSDWLGKGPDVQEKEKYDTLLLVRAWQVEMKTFVAGASTA